MTCEVNKTSEGRNNQFDKMMLETSNMVLINDPCLITTSFQRQLYQVQRLNQFNMFAAHARVYLGTRAN